MRRLRILSLIIRTLTFGRLTSLTMNETGLKHVTTEDDIKEKLGGEQLIPIFLVKGCFEKFIQRNIHVIVQVPATDKFLRVKGSHERLKMSSHIVEGKFCLFHGHRQSGKMTAAWELKRWIETNSKHTVKDLLAQYAEDNKFEIEVDNIAADVYSLTLGHKGLVGNCCYYFEQKIMSGAIKATLDD
ncbi:hypothetical protein RhiirA1_443639 [Rhizophagus irregularis]|uniref:Uncharacterized protein n=1 Tax=Rhizophagus irregularis TaxID=588596 RepID=A0A2I1ER65_9GLOM|nr:hypothetical protein RhiirA1_443639 [Rhizophagus irregularis]PKY24620.1 hypothetical protein RhiirB3_472088 [Rhizophagus irregularis]